MSKVTLSQLAELTGRTWRTCRARLQASGLEPVEHSGKSALYASPAALAKAQRLRLETDADVRSGQLLPLAQVLDDVGDMIGACRSRLVALPDVIGQVLDANTARIVVPAVRIKVYEALAELASYRPTLSDEADEAVESAADVASDDPATLDA